EFAGSGFTHSKLWGVTRNPWNLERTPSGSSGGSVRGPAAACGIVGMKPSLGRIPFDLLPTAYDNRTHFGLLARSRTRRCSLMSPRGRTTATPSPCQRFPM
ncbi:MAG: hypothetical protein EXQ94_14465, partial [Alphaproteobacteria bacterium]|nr:hypothetical protein [Alphaproteobacteria bacterium]